MLLNYLKITLKVLARNPLFTFVSLFGIVFTLVILLVLTSFIDHLVAPHYPDVNRDRSLYVGYLRCEDPDIGAARTGPPSFYFLDTYVRKMKTPQQIGIASFPAFANAYAGNRRLKLNLKFTDAAFWSVTAFDFLEGKSYTAQNIDNGDYVAVINEKTRTNYFGADVQAVGQSIVVENVSYRVIGVVRDVPITRPIMSADLYLPHNVSKSQAQGQSLTGHYVGILVAESKKDFDRIQQEYRHIVGSIPMPMTDGGFTFKEINAGADTYIDTFLGTITGSDNSTHLFYIVIGILMLLFMLLPAINLVNLNVSRIMERSSEIGVRKAFGASSGRLVVQFLVENVFITLIGGLIAVSLAFLIVSFFNGSGWIPGADLTINARVFLVGIGVCLVFGLLSGVAPAFRMSRLHVIDALRGGENN